MRFLLITALLVLALFQSASLACTAFVAYRGGLALAGNNEDFYHTKTRIWFVPPEEGRFGHVYLGYDDGFPQGGMNDQGLFYDGFATRLNPVTKSADKPFFAGNITDKIMTECATVQEVVDLLSRYNLKPLETAMLMFADRHGDSVIIEGDEFLRIKGPYQVVTNFYQSLLKGEQVTCRRFKTATRMLEENPEISVDLFCRILDAVHVENGVHSQYSNICDLKKGIVYLYHFHNFEEVKVFDLEEELKKGAHSYDIPELFPENPTFAAFEEKREKEKEDIRKKRRDTSIGPEAFDEYTGRYTLTSEEYGGAVFTVHREGDRLMGKLLELYDIELIPEGKDTFFQVVDYGTMQFRFTRDEHGKVAHLTRELLGLNRKWEAERVQ